MLKKTRNKHLRQAESRGIEKLRTLMSGRRALPGSWRKSGGYPRLRLRKPQDLDIRGLGMKLCQVLGVRSGDTIAFHILGDGSVRVINYSHG
jgi:hypothetical protein